MLSEKIDLDTFDVSLGTLADLVQLDQAKSVKWNEPSGESFREDAAQAGVWAISPYAEDTWVLFAQLGEVYAFPVRETAVASTREKVVLATY